jgi:hypothetical protein
VLGDAFRLDEYIEVGKFPTDVDPIAEALTRRCSAQ